MPFGLLAPKDISIVCLSKRLSMGVPYDGYSRKASKAIWFQQWTLEFYTMNMEKQNSRAINWQCNNRFNLQR